MRKKTKRETRWGGGAERERMYFGRLLNKNDE